MLARGLVIITIVVAVLVAIHLRMILCFLSGFHFQCTARVDEISNTVDFDLEIEKNNILDKMEDFSVSLN